MEFLERFLAEVRDGGQVASGDESDALPGSKRGFGTPPPTFGTDKRAFGTPPEPSGTPPKSADSDARTGQNQASGTFGTPLATAKTEDSGASGTSGTSGTTLGAPSSQTQKPSGTSGTSGTPIGAPILEGLKKLGLGVKGELTQIGPRQWQLVRRLDNGWTGRRIATANPDDTWTVVVHPFNAEYPDTGGPACPATDSERDGFFEILAETLERVAIQKSLFPGAEPGWPDPPPFPHPKPFTDEEIEALGEPAVMEAIRVLGARLIAVHPSGTIDEEEPPVPGPPQEGAPTSWRTAGAFLAYLRSIDAHVGLTGGMLWCHAPAENFSFHVAAALRLFQVQLRQTAERFAFEPGMAPGWVRLRI